MFLTLSAQFERFLTPFGVQVEAANERRLIANMTRTWP